MARARVVRTYRVHMGTDGIGSSVVIALAAVLWLVYLIPTWFRSREYLTTERNAVRLQQTIRIMAETAAVPQTVRLEADARTVAHQERLLRQQFDREQAVLAAREAAMNQAAVRTLATLKPALASQAMLHSPAARRLRRARAATTSVLLIAVLAVAASLTPLVAAIGPLLLAGGAVIAVAAVALLVRMSAVSRRRERTAAELRARLEQPRRRFIADEPAVASSPATWTPVPLPKPLYLDRPAPQPLVSASALAEERDRRLEELASAERAAVVAEQAEKVTPIRPAAAPTSSPARTSPWAGMGVVDHSDTTVTDLDAVLRRRRAV